MSVVTSCSDDSEVNYQNCNLSLCKKTKKQKNKTQKAQAYIRFVIIK